MSLKHALPIIIIFLICAVSLVFRLFALQIIYHDRLTQKADQQQMKTMDLEQNSRGRVLDRNGESITNHQETPSLMIFPSLVKNPDYTAEKLSEILFLDHGNLYRKIEGVNEEGTSVRYLPFSAKTNLTTKEISLIQALDEPGIFIVGQVGRYQSDLPAIHLLGELGVVTEKDLLAGNVDSRLHEGDSVGLSGIERIYDSILQGRGGETLSVIVDDRNRPVYDDEYYVADYEEVSSGSVKLTLDLEIQRVVESALDDVNGAAVILDSQSGDVLAMASSPKYDPNHVESLTSDDAYLNKALNPYPPASLFKIFLAAVALEEGVMQNESIGYCNGFYHLENGRDVHCWEEDGHGFLLFEEALSLSCNPVFVNVGIKLGIDRIQNAFEAWGLDEDALIGYPLKQHSGIFTEGKTEGDIANLSLGENGVAMTPLNLAKMINVIASGGFLMGPRLVMEANPGDGSPVKTYSRSYPVRIIKESTAKDVTEMLCKTFQTGTGKSLHLQAMDLAGKTGTSEAGNVWIGGFFPAESPRYTIVILVEEGSSGVGDGGPVLKKICAYLNSLIIENDNSI